MVRDDFAERLAAIEQALQEDVPAALAGLDELRRKPRWGRRAEVLELVEAAGRRCSREGLARVFDAGAYDMHTPQPWWFLWDGGPIELGSDERDLVLVDPRSGDELQRLRGHTYPVCCVAVDAPGARILSGSADKTTRVWERASGRTVAVFSTVETPGFTAFSPDGRLALSGPPIAVWDTATGRELRTIRVNRRARPLDAAFSFDGTLLVSVWDDGIARLFKVATGRLLAATDGDRQLATCAFTRDGRVLLGGRHGVYVWARGSDASGVAGPLGGGGQEALLLQPLPDPRYCLSGSSEGSFLWDLRGGSCLQRLRHRPLRPAVGLGCARFACEGAAGNWQLCYLDWIWKARPEAPWDPRAEPLLNDFLTRTKPFAGELPPDREPTPEEQERALTRVGRSEWSERELEGFFAELADAGLGWLSPDALRARLARQAVVSESQRKRHAKELHRLLNTAGIALKARRFKACLQTLRKARELPGCDREPLALAMWESLSEPFPHDTLRGEFRLGRFSSLGSVHAVAISPEGERALVGGSSLELGVWELSTPAQRARLLGHTGAIRAVAWLPDGRHALSGGDDGPVRLWDVHARTCVRALKGHMGPIQDLAVSDDGRFALSASLDGTARLWHLDSGWCLRVLTAHDGPVRAVAFSPDLRFGITAGDDRLIRIWKLGDGAVARDLAQHRDRVDRLTVSTHGRWLLSGAADGEVRMWDLGSGRCNGLFRGHTAPIELVFACPDSRHAVTSDGAVAMVWNLTTGRCEAELPHGLRAVSPNARHGLAVDGGDLQRWYLDWLPAVRSHADSWDPDVEMHIELFLAQHTPFAGRPIGDREPLASEIDAALTRAGNPLWDEEAVLRLLAHLGQVGLGWVEPKKVRDALEERRPKSAMKRLFGFLRKKD